MKFELIVEAYIDYSDHRNVQRKFHLKLRNVDTGETITLLDGNSMSYLKSRGSDLFNGESHLAGQRVNWCDGDDPLYDSTEYFTL